ncbi:MAG TPA: hypothetical protein DEQ84_05180 [Prevotellaceae bacterium]|nr:hypothetical protein [Prevotellaceae bacterium]
MSLYLFQQAKVGNPPVTGKFFTDIRQRRGLTIQKATQSFRTGRLKIETAKRNCRCAVNGKTKRVRSNDTNIRNIRYLCKECYHINILSHD